MLSFLSGGALRNRTPYRSGIHPSFQDWWPTIQPERSVLVPSEGLEPINLLILNQAPLPIGLTGRIGARGRIRTDTVESLELVPPTSWATRAGAAPRIRTETDPGLNWTLLPIEREPLKW